MDLMSFALGASFCSNDNDYDEDYDEIINYLQKLINKYNNTNKKVTKNMIIKDLKELISNLV